MSNRQTFIQALAAVSLTALGACADEGPDTGPSDVSTPDGYTADWSGMTALAEDHCQECHAEGGMAGFFPLPAGLAWDLEDSAERYVVPFDPDASKVWRVLAGELGPGEIEMPFGGRLPLEDVAHVKAWIEAGAPYEPAPRPGAR